MFYPAFRYLYEKSFTSGILIAEIQVNIKKEIITEKPVSGQLLEFISVEKEFLPQYLTPSYLNEAYDD